MPSTRSETPVSTVSETNRSHTPTTRTRPTKAPSSPVKKDEKPQIRQESDLKDLKLGDCLGKGAFGSVYRALVWSTGDTVAVKQIKLQDLHKSEVRVMMQEIDLLSQLEHPNIVKYQGFVKTAETLNIILEYCENGSLHSIAKSFGRFPEHLVALYMSQALDGLAYLHAQGVMHRDIKGANILSTKNGLIKLADFGVASRTTGAHESNGVVGTPYWMAPEVIELTGASTASDIWSLGCTVIELLDGKPPYHNFQPMPALFRIVSDDHPPLPAGASPIVLDFLMQCFQKDPYLRIDAVRLKSHQWLVNTARKDGKIKKNTTEHQEAVKAVQQWNQALKDSPPAQNGRKNSTSSADGPVPTSKENLRARPSTKMPPLQTQLRNQTERFRSAEHENDNWDDDFASAISPRALQLPHLRPVDNFGGILSAENLKAMATRNSPQNDKSFEDNSATVKPAKPFKHTTNTTRSTRPEVKSNNKTTPKHVRHRSELPKQKPPVPVQTARKVSLPPQIKGLQAGTRHVDILPASETAVRTLYREPSLEDYSDIIDGNELILDKKLGAMRIQQDGPTNLVESPSVTDLLREMKSSNAASRAQKPQQKQSRAAMRRTRSSVEIQKYAENEDDEDFSDVFGQAAKIDTPVASSSSPTSDPFTFASKRSMQSWLDEDEDPFAHLEEELPEGDLESNVLRDKHARMKMEVEELVGQLKILRSDEDALLHISESLINYFGHFSGTKSVIISAHGLLPILEILEICDRDDIILNLLRIVNTLIYGDEVVQQNLCFVGGIPKILCFASRDFEKSIRLEAAAFVKQMYESSVLILQMFVSAGGLSVLVSFLEDSYDEERELVLIGVNGIWSVFEKQGSTLRNDLCRILSKTVVLDPLSLVLTRVVNESAVSGQQRELAALCESRIASIFLIFSQAENYVKEHVAEQKVLRRLLKNLHKTSHTNQIIILKFIKNLSMLEARWDTLQYSNAIDVLVELLRDGADQPHFRELSNQILGTIYNLCRVSKRRQEDAAEAGIIPVLLKIAKQDKTPVRQFALPILCDMVQAGSAARKELWQNKGLQFYVSLLSDTYWQGTALDSIFIWLQEETARVQSHLLQEQKFTLAVVSALTTSQSASFENLLEPLKKLLRLSPPLAEQMASSPELFESIGSKLNDKKPAIRLNLLHIISSIRDATESGSFLLDQHGLYDLVSDLQFSDPSLLVKSMAKELIKTCQEIDSISNYSDHRAQNNASRNSGRRPAVTRRQSSSTTPPHMNERVMTTVPVSPQLSRPMMAHYEGTERPAQTPRRQRNGIGYVNGSIANRPVSRDGSTTYLRESSPALPHLARAQTSSAALNDMAASRTRLSRQSGVGVHAPSHRLHRQSTRESLSSVALTNSSTPTLTPVSERRRENTPASDQRGTNRVTVNSRSRNVEIHAASQSNDSSSRRTGTAGRTPGFTRRAQTMPVSESGSRDGDSMDWGA